MIQAFVVYNLLMLLLIGAWAIAAAGNVTPIQGRSGSVSNILVATFSVVIFTAVLGLRFNVGGDYESYVDYYITTTSSLSYKDVPFEAGFYWLIRALKAFDLPTSSLFLATCAIQMMVMSVWLSRQSDAAPWLIYFYFTSLLGFEALNTIRQAMALMFILLAISALMRPRPWLYYVWILLAASLHVSALIFLPLGLLINREWLPGRVWLLAILFGSYVSAGAIKDMLFNILPLFAFVDLLSGYSSLQDQLFFERDVGGVSLGTVSILMFDSLIIYCSPWLLKRYERNGFRAYFNLFFIGAVMTPVVIAANYITFARLAFYFTSFRFVAMAFLVAWLVSRDVRFPFAKLVALGLVVSSLGSFFVAIARGAAWSAPFQFIFQ